MLKLFDRILKRGRVVVGDKDLILKEDFKDGVIDKQLRYEMHRFSIEHPDAIFQAFRQEVFKWTQDLKPQTADLSQASEQVDVQADMSTQNVDQPLEMLGAQQKQIDLLTNLVQSRKKTIGSPSRAGGRGRWRSNMRRPCFRGRGIAREMGASRP